MEGNNVRDRQSRKEKSCLNFREDSYIQQAKDTERKTERKTQLSTRIERIKDFPLENDNFEQFALSCFPSKDLTLIW